MIKILTVAHNEGIEAVIAQEIELDKHVAMFWLLPECTMEF